MHLLLASYGTTTCVHMGLHTSDNIWKDILFLLRCGINEQETLQAPQDSYQSPNTNWKRSEINSLGDIQNYISYSAIILFSSVSHVQYFNSIAEHIQIIGDCVWWKRSQVYSTTALESQQFSTWATDRSVGPHPGPPDVVFNTSSLLEAARFEGASTHITFRAMIELKSLWSVARTVNWIRSTILLPVGYIWMLSWKTPDLGTLQYWAHWLLMIKIYHWYIQRHTQRK